MGNSFHSQSSTGSLSLALFLPGNTHEEKGGRGQREGRMGEERDGRRGGREGGKGGIEGRNGKETKEEGGKKKGRQANRLHHILVGEVRPSSKHTTVLVKTASEKKKKKISQNKMHRLFSFTDSHVPT